MEQRLIDANYLIHKKGNLDEYANFYYTEQDIGECPTIDPVHAAGACYCRECENRNEKYLQGEGNLYCHITHNRVSPTHFCGDGKRGSTNQCDSCVSGSYRGCDGCSYSDNSP